MELDPVLTEIRSVREAYAEKFAGDVKAMVTDIRNRQKLWRTAIGISPAKAHRPDTGGLGSTPLVGLSGSPIWDSLRWSNDRVAQHA